MKKKYKITVVRTTYTAIVLEVEGIDEHEAKEKAIANAKFCWAENGELGNAEYETESVEEYNQWN